MKIKNILIKNFKSIKNLNIPLQEYGDGTQKSKATFLVGINESGKSAILEAISLINEGFDKIDYDDYCFNEAQEENGYIDIYAELELDNIGFWKEQIVEKLGMDKHFVEKINFLKLVKNTFRNKQGANVAYNLTINDDIPCYEYIINTTKKTENNKIRKVETIEVLKEFNEIEVDITKENAKSFLNENQRLLTKKDLEGMIVNSLYSVLEQKMPKIQIWKSKPEYLINEIIDLNEFKEDTSVSFPLRNIFHIYGKTSDNEIKETIERALSKQERSDELKAKMSDKVTRHINRIWKEHRIKIIISINGSSCQVQVEDKDKKFAYYTMAQRSDGFKQFISLILSLSAQNDSNNLRDNIILIDEPEVHLHPSGIKYMRDEILKIGKNNNIIVATHSQYMVDTTTSERHWIVQKNKSETSILQINEDTPLEDDKVLASAFGLNLLKELLPENIIIVEGGDDKKIISHSLKLLKERFFYSIKSAGGASKVPGFATLLADEDVPAFILFDADKEGRDNKKRILDNQKEVYSTRNVFTLKDLHSTLPNDSTIEDLYPIDFVKDFFEREMNQDFTLEDNRAVIHQLKNQSSILKQNKQRLDSLNNNLSNEFCNKYRTKSDIESISRLCSLINVLIEKIEEK